MIFKKLSAWFNTLEKYIQCLLPIFFNSLFLPSHFCFINLFFFFLTQYSLIFYDSKILFWMLKHTYFFEVLLNLYFHFSKNNISRQLSHIYKQKIFLAPATFQRIFLEYWEVRLFYGSLPNAYLLCAYISTYINVSIYICMCMRVHICYVFARPFMSSQCSTSSTFAVKVFPYWFESIAKLFLLF